MKPWFAALLGCASIAVCAADQSDMPVPATAQQRAARPRQAAPAAANTAPAAAVAAPAARTAANAAGAAANAVGAAANAVGAAANAAGAAVHAAALSSAESPDAPKFTTEAKWLLAGYNNNEIVYTIIVTSQDSRIIRCTTDMQGFYFDNGEKQSISDRQVTTVFPNQPTQVGNWMDMDEKSGATYTVKCKPA